MHSEVKEPAHQRPILSSTPFSHTLSFGSIVRPIETFTGGQIIISPDGNKLRSDPIPQHTPSSYDVSTELS